MDRVGGYGAYQALAEDARAYQDIVLVIRAEAQAKKIREAERNAK